MHHGLDSIRTVALCGVVCDEVRCYPVDLVLRKAWPSYRRYPQTSFDLSELRPTREIIRWLATERRLQSSNSPYV